MKLTLNLALTVLSVFLTPSVHVTDGQPNQYPHYFSSFLQRLERFIEKSSADALPFIVKNDLIENLKRTSHQFQEYCEQYYAGQPDNGSVSTVSALAKAISYVFYNYIKSTSYWNREILEEIQSTDPIGFLVYLNEKNVNESSPNFKQTIEEYQEAMYKRVPIPNSRFYLSDFFEFIQRLKTSINSLPFVLKGRVVEDLWLTSNNFKQSCILHERSLRTKTGNFSPAESLNRTIKSIFYDYEEGAKQSVRMLREIESVDPVGFNGYLTKKNVNVKSPTFSALIEEFWQTMQQRVRLFRSRTDNSQIDFFEGNRKRKVHVIDDVIRERVTTEYAPFSRLTIDFFIKLAMEQFPKIKMYSLGDFNNVRNFKEHKSSKKNDIQISYGFMENVLDHHAICIFYHAQSKEVRVYDSSMYKKLDSKQLEIIARLYPFRKDIVFMEPKTRQYKTPTCGIFAIIYANMLLLGSDPAEIEFKLNMVHGDDTLYMRLHIMNMFANRKLIMMPN